MRPKSSRPWPVTRGPHSGPRSGKRRQHLIWPKRLGEVRISHACSVEEPLSYETSKRARWNRWNCITFRSHAEVVGQRLSQLHQHSIVPLIRIDMSKKSAGKTSGQGAELMADLTTLFNNSGGAPVQFGGGKVQPGLWLPVSARERFRIEIRKFTKLPVQGLQLVARATRGKPRDVRCQVEVAGKTGTDFVLWTDTAPHHIQILVREAPAGSQIGVWNVWRHPRHDTMLYGMNNAGVEVISESEDQWLLRCSDGVGDANFDDLVFELRRLR